MLALAVQLDQMLLLNRRQLRLLASQLALRLGDLHALARMHPDEFRLELRERREHVEHHVAHGVRRIVGATLEPKRHLLLGQFVGDVLGIPDRLRQPTAGLTEASAFSRPGHSRFIPVSPSSR